jgi:hypothetical protein
MNSSMRPRYQDLASLIGAVDRRPGRSLEGAGGEMAGLACLSCVR